MVQLTSIRKDIDPKTGKPKLPWWHLSKFAKINICMGLSIVAGLWSFVLVRDNVMIQRRQQMKFRKELEVKVKNEVLEEAETAGDKAKKYNL